MKSITYVVSPIVGADLYWGHSLARALEVYTSAKGCGRVELKECKYYGDYIYLQSILAKVC